MQRSKGRLTVFAAGAILALVGYVRLKEGVFVVRHWTGQPMFSYGLIAAGLVLIIVAVVPVRLISGTTNRKKSD